MRLFNMKSLLLVAALAMTIVVFQNCSQDYNAVQPRSPASSQTSIPSLDNDPPTTNTNVETRRTVQERMADLQKRRLKEWTPKNPYWEVYWDGSDTPGDNVAGPFMWDNPVDDDWFDPLLNGSSVYMDQFRLNTPSRGFMTVDRTSGANYKTGSIFRRDEWLWPEFIRAIYGITIELRVKLLRSSGVDAFSINYVGADCTVSVALSGASAKSSVGTISSGSIYGGHTNHRALDTTSDFITLRLVRGPNFSNFEVFVVAYADPDASMPASYSNVHVGTCDPQFKVGSAPAASFPYIQIGDNSNEPHHNAAYVIDFVRYRRDAIFPNQPLASIHGRVPVTLPATAPKNEDALYTGGYYGDVPVDSSAVRNGLSKDARLYGGAGPWKSSGSTGVALLDTSGDKYSDFEIIHPHGLPDKGAYTIEARLKLLPESGDRGFRISHLDALGSVSLYLSPKKVETGMGTKPAGFLKHAMNTTDDFHVYRIVRTAGSLYAHVYVDNDPVPVIVDQHLSAETESRGFEANPILSFGGYRVYPEPFVFPVKTTHTKILIDYIKWHPAAYAPRAATP